MKNNENNRNGAVLSFIYTVKKIPSKYTLVPYIGTAEGTSRILLPFFFKRKNSLSTDFQLQKKITVYVLYDTCIELINYFGIQHKRKEMIK
jgi:hypothetical protein